MTIGHNRLLGRRTLLGLGLATLGTGILAGPAAADVFKAPERSLSFLNLHTGEAIKATYWEAGSYVTGALSAVNRVLRDFRTGDIHPIDTRLLDTLAALGARIGASAPFQVISAYRSPASNAALSARSGEVAKHSLHMEGMAMDIRMPGVDLAHLHEAALSMGRGGVGYYPTSNFVHVDVGRVRSWRGT